VIQHIYDRHYLGAEQAAGFVTRWQTLRGLMDEARFGEVLDRLEFQAGHAIVWRDAVTTWFARTSGIPDEKGRVGHVPGRTEVESMRLTGFAPRPVTPSETASNGVSVTCQVATGCAAQYDYRGTAGTFDVAVGFFDQSDGASKYRLLVGGREVGRWVASRDLPHVDSNGHTATRTTFHNVRLMPGDTLTVEATPDANEPAPLDYIEVTPAR
jgi:alpha-glucuronidase